LIIWKKTRKKREPGSWLSTYGHLLRVHRGWL